VPVPQVLGRPVPAPHTSKFPVTSTEGDAGLAQPVNSIQWLEDRGYVLLPLGVSNEVAAGWSTYDAVLFGAIAVAAGLLSLWIVNRRRPA
jgi:hypothetical protein